MCSRFGALLCLVTAGLPAWPAVRVWQDTIALRTYDEGPPNPDAPFPLLDHSNPLRYPYTVRLGFTHNRSEHSWRALHIANEYLSCIVLPDLGGRLYTCKDSFTGHDMFYANPAVRKAEIGLRGAWAAMGMELNFPVAHTWTTVSPVDFAIAQGPDGSASIWVGNVERVYGMQWSVEFVLQPGVAALEQRVRLYNPTYLPRPYFWWSNASVDLVDGKTRFIYPTHLVATHGLREIMSWPLDPDGVDKSVVGSYKKGAGLFAHGSRESFMAIYHPALRAGTVHYADSRQLPGKKLWTWGEEGDKEVRRDLSDNGTSYVEMQAGLFENQETYQFLEPEQTVSFTEYWMPAHDLSGISRANSHGILNVQRETAAGGNVRLRVEFNSTRIEPGASIRILDGEKAVSQETVKLDPAMVFSWRFDLPSGPRYKVQIAGGDGAVLLEHTEGECDADGTETVKLGTQPVVDLWKSLHSAADYLRAAVQNELNGFLRFARHDYQQGLERFPGDAELLTGLGRVDISQHRLKEATGLLAQAENPAARYYSGLSKVESGDDLGAAKEFEGISETSVLHAAALQALAEIGTRSGDLKAALATIRAAQAGQPEMIRAGATEVALLRHLTEERMAVKRLEALRMLNPTDSLLRYEQTKLGKPDDALWLHLAADPERVLNIADFYLSLGFCDDAIDLLSRKYPPLADPLTAEPGAVLPQDDPLIAYYRGYCRIQAGRSGQADFEEASKLSLAYIFPNRASSFKVLHGVVRKNPADVTALSLLGSLYLGSDDPDGAIEWWTRARKAHSTDVSLYRNLGRVLYEIKNDRQGALDTYREGLKMAPTDPVIKRGVELALRPAKQ